MILDGTRNLVRKIRAQPAPPPRPSRVEAYHERHHREALAALERLGCSGRTLAEKDRLRSEEYAREVFGHPRYAYWLQVYAAVQGGFSEGWIPDNAYGADLLAPLKGAYGRISKIKSLSARVLQTRLLPDMGSWVNGVLTTPEGEVIDKRDPRSWLFAETDSVVFKPDEGEQGRGLQFWTRGTFRPDDLWASPNGVVQKALRGPSLWRELRAGELPTLRLTTVSDEEGEASVRGAYLRFAASSGHVRGETALAVPLALDGEGQLQARVRAPDWTFSSHLPGSSRRLEEYRFPRFRESLAMALELQRRVPFVRCVGWDFVVDEEEELWLLEWNGEHNDIKFHEAFTGPCFADLGWEALVRTSLSP